MFRFDNFENSDLPNSNYYDAYVIDAELNDETRSLFNKKFQYAPSDWKLPASSLLFSTPPWVIERLELLKNRLNFHKSQLNDFNIEEWSMHTRRRNPAGEVGWKVKCVINPEFLTQAWTKFYECACTYNIIPSEVLLNKKMVSLHLCEAPGAFIASLNHYLQSNFQGTEWFWVASTLNPYYEGNSLANMINDDRFMFHTLDHWEFGTDNTGNLMDWDNSQAIIQRAKSLGKVMLVTADGSIDCLERPDAQEEITSSLHYCEIVTGLQALSEGGTLIFKLFTVFEHSTVNLMYLVNNLFSEVHIYKPATSRQGNSEVYAVCLGFHGYDILNLYIPILKMAYGTELYLNKTMFPIECIPEDFLEQVFNCANYFCEKQCEVINKNLEAYFLTADKYTANKIKKLRLMVSSEFIVRYNLRQLSWNQEISKGILHQNVTINTNLKYHRGSYTERKKFGDLPCREKLKYLTNFFGKDVLCDPTIFLPEPIKWLSLYNPETEIFLNFIYGKPILKINSSKFIFVPILKLHEDIMAVDEFRNVVMKNKHVSSSPNFNCVKYKTMSLLEFDYNELYDVYEKRYFVKLYSTLIEMEEGETISLKNFNLLTQFNVSIIYFLCSKCFEKIGFKDCNTVVLHNLMNKAELKHLKITCDEITKLASKGMTVLSILAVAMTNCNEFYNDIVFYNNTVYRNKCFDYLNCITQVFNKKN